jgi:hypothetical protein
MESKFKIGQEVYYMNCNEPAKGLIKGIAFIVGNFTDSFFSREATEDKPCIVYSIGGYAAIDEDKVYASKMDLQNALFSKL